MGIKIIKRALIPPKKTFASRKLPKKGLPKKPSKARKRQQTQRHGVSRSQSPLKKGIQRKTSPLKKGRGQR